MKIKLFDLQVVPAMTEKPPIVRPPSPFTDRRWWIIAFAISSSLYLITKYG